MAPDRTISTTIETPLPDTSDSRATVRPRTLSAIEMIVEQHVDAVTIARRLSVDPDTIRAEMTRGNLPYARIGRKRVVPISAVEAYVAARAVGDHPAKRKTPPVAAVFSPARRRTA